MKKVILIIVLLYSYGLVKAQSIRECFNFTQLNINFEAKPKPVIKPISRLDTVYCLMIKRQNGWVMPLKEISKEQAKHYNCVYRFSNRYKNEKSDKFKKLEIIDGYGNLTSNHNLNPYILRLTDINKAWAEKIKTTCQYEFVCDPSKNEIVKELCYDKNKNLIYSYTRRQKDKDVSIGSYTDAENNSFDVLEFITANINGYDYYVDFIDENGKRKFSDEDVPTYKFHYDKNGFLIDELSTDAVGAGDELVIANWNNLGSEYIYDKNNNVEFEIQYIKDGGLAAKILQYKYDKFGRKTEEKYFYVKRNESADTYLYKTTFEYNDYGEIIKQQVSDSNDNPVGISKKVYNYNSLSDTILHKEWITQNGMEKLFFVDSIAKNFRYTMWSNNCYRIDSLDDRGIIISQTFYDENNKLISDSVKIKASIREVAITFFNYQEYSMAYKLFEQLAGNDKESCKYMYIMERYGYGTVKNGKNAEKWKAKIDKATFYKDIVNIFEVAVGVRKTGQIYSDYLDFKKNK